MKQIFVVPGRLPGMNEITNSNRGNRYAGAKLKKEAQATVCWAIKESGLTPVTRPFYLHCTWIEPNMRRDKDNVRAGVKFILDALQETGVIRNDGWREVVGFTDSYKVNRKDPRIIVEIEEIEK